MSSQKYRNFDTDDSAAATVDTGGAETPTGVTYDPNVTFRASGATFWQRRTLLEKGLLVVLAGFVLMVFSMAIVIAQKHDHVKWLQGQKLCTSKECVTLASNVLNSLDPSMDPCEDFYQYACGGWKKDNPIPSGHARWSTFNLLIQKNELVVKNALEADASSSVSEAERKARVYFQSCMDVNGTIQTLGDQPMQDLLKQVNGWNISHNDGSPGFNASTWSLQYNLQLTHKMGISALFGLFVSEDAKDNTHNILYVDQGGLGLARDQYLTNKTIEEDPILSAYLAYMVDIGVLLGGEENSTQTQMLQVLEWEIQLANITTPSEERRDDEKLYHKMTVADVQNLAPCSPENSRSYTESRSLCKINWVEYMTSIFSEVDVRITESEPVVVYAPEYLTALTQLMAQQMSTVEGNKPSSTLRPSLNLWQMSTVEGNNTLNNYMKWHLVRTMARSLSQPFVDANKVFSKAVTGVEGTEETWRLCVGDTGGSLGFAVGAMFVRAAFHGESRSTAEDMVQAVKAAFKLNLPNLKWMDQQTRTAAIEKVEAVVDRIGYPDYILNTTALDDKYSGFEVAADEYFLNSIRDIKHSLKKSLLKLRKPPDNTRWEMTPQQVNAYYTPTKNQIVFPAGILQLPFFDQNYPTSVNYGGMGVVMGHELTHGFDDQGREYDKTGLLKPWWNNASVENFKKEAQCFIDEYTDFSVNGEHLRGKQTLGENIADNGGLKAAYHAYGSWVAENGEENLLPGVSLNHRQLFFLAFAQIWCSNTNPKAEHLGLITDPHSPGKFRVLGTLANSREFSEQYKCAAGTPMNPNTKCVLW